MAKIVIDPLNRVEGHLKIEAVVEKLEVKRAVLAALESRLDERAVFATNTSSMARTTGYTCSAAARLVLNGDFTKKGIKW